MRLTYDEGRQCGRCHRAIPDRMVRRGRMVRPRRCSGCIKKVRAGRLMLGGRRHRPLSYAGRVEMGMCGRCGRVRPNKMYKLCMRCRIMGLRKARIRRGIPLDKPLPEPRLNAKPSPEPTGMMGKELRQYRGMVGTCTRCGGVRDRSDRKQCMECRSRGAARVRKCRSKSPKDTSTAPAQESAIPPTQIQDPSKVN